MYYNQNDIGAIPYPAKGYESATVKSGGCGVCCASMVVEGLTNTAFHPRDSAAFAIKCGARVPGGTDFKRLSAALAEAHGLKTSTTSDAGALKTCIESGGMAVANVGGDRSGYTGLFSNGGHYVVVMGMESGRFIVWDPGFYKGKFDKSGRRGRITVRGNDILVDPTALAADCQNRSPMYYLFSAEKGPRDAASAWAAEAWNAAFKAGILDGENPKDGVSRQMLATVLHRLGLF